MWGYKEEEAIGLFIHRIDKILLSLFFLRLNKQSSLSLTSLDRNCSLLIILIALCWTFMYVQVSLLLGRPGCSSSDMILTCLSSTSLGLPAAIFPTQPRFWFAFSVGRTHCWSVFCLVSAWFLVCKAVFQPAYPPYILVNRVCLHLTFPKFVRLLSACFSSLSNCS